ncbi:ABC transporter permease [Fulvivirgaceae bacterium BMA10]|uniref:ABC transporter permease n=1 Tax=Splendidivirga corallicola TaxID=3051826 RepID=A0ABT8KXR0_9BACT|nr:ABC transporter permease [Fulvivirgaceae bacterium BMA10]
MLKNYIKIAYRNLLKNKVFSLINIVGLAFGSSCAILIMLWVWDEMRHDQFHTNKDHLYQLIVEMDQADGSSETWVNTPGGLLPALHKDVPEIVDFTRMTARRRLLFNYNDQRNYERGHYADTSFFKMFSFPFLEGNKQTALRDPQSIVISKDFAQRFFGNEPALGKVLSISGLPEAGYKISGIIENIPAYSSLRFDFIIPMQDYVNRNEWLKNCDNYDLQAFVQLADDSDWNHVGEKVRSFLTDLRNEEGVHLKLFPLKDLYLYADFGGANVRIRYVKLFSMAAFIILLIACINFMNLSTARSVKRAKEVGIRKTSGAKRRSLIIQFMGESILITLISMLLAITLAHLILPYFNQLTSKELTFPFEYSQFYILILIVTLLIGTISGSYPAFYLSSFNPLKVLKGSGRQKGSSDFIRKGLVIFQFTLSIILIVCTIIVYQQIHYVKNMDIGFDQENIVYFWTRDGISKHKQTFKKELTDNVHINAFTYLNFLPSQILNTTGSVKWPGMPEEGIQYFHVMQGDQDFLKTFDVELLKGKNFPEVASDDKKYFLINERAQEVMGYVDPLNQEIEVWDYEGSIVGVIKDFNHASLYSQIEPVIVMLNSHGPRIAFTKLSGDNLQETLAFIKASYEKYEAEFPFEYHFLDQEFENTYKTVLTVANLANVFSFIAIFISCLGLFGLSSYVTEQRIQEIGIRKVLGASVLNLSLMFTRSFVFLVLIAFLIAVPIAWLVGNNWLEDFSYKITLGPGMFIIGGCIAIMIAIATVSYHIITAANANPIDSLKYE